MNLKDYIRSIPDYPKKGILFRDITTLIKNADAFGNKTNEKRKKPYPPNFNKIPAKSIEPAVGASQCASGNQTWKGIIGIFTAKEKKKASQQSFSVKGSKSNIAKIK